jgi:hypothetical protein
MGSKNSLSLSGGGSRGGSRQRKQVCGVNCLLKPVFSTCSHPDYLHQRGSGYFLSPSFSRTIPHILNHSHNSYLLTCEDGTDSVPKRWHLSYRLRVITQKKAYNITLCLFSGINVLSEQIGQVLKCTLLDQGIYLCLGNRVMMVKWKLYGTYLQHGITK